jgi:hypothetical protein
MTIDRINQVFKLIGKMLYIIDVMQERVSAFDLVGLNLDRQYVAGPASPTDAYGELQAAVVQPFFPVAQVTGIIPQFAGNVTSAITNYLYFLAPELGLQSNATTTDIVTALATQLQTAGGSIAPGGQYHQFFSGQYQFFNFPQSNTPTISESWITADLV